MPQKEKPQQKSRRSRRRASNRKSSSSAASSSSSGAADKKPISNLLNKICKCPAGTSSCAECAVTGADGRAGHRPWDELELRHHGLSPSPVPLPRDDDATADGDADRVPSASSYTRLSFPTKSKEAIIAPLPRRASSDLVFSSDSSSGLPSDLPPTPRDELEMERAGLVTRSGQHIHTGPDDAPPPLRVSSKLGAPGHIAFLSKSREAVVTKIDSEDPDAVAEALQAANRRQPPMDELAMERAGLVTRSGQHLHKGPVDAPPPLRVSSKLGAPGHILFPSSSREAIISKIDSEEGPDVPADARRPRKPGQPSDEVELAHRGLVTKSGRHLHPGRRDQPLQMGPSPKLGQPGHIAFPSKSREAYLTKIDSKDDLAASASQRAAEARRGRKAGQPSDEVELAHRGLVTKSGRHLHPGRRDQPLQMGPSPKLGALGHIAFPSPSKEAVSCGSCLGSPSEEARTAQKSASAARRERREQKPMDELAMRRRGLISDRCEHRHPGLHELTGKEGPPPPALPLNLYHPDEESDDAAEGRGFPKTAAATGPVKTAKRQAVVGGGTLTSFVDGPRSAYLLQLSDKLVYVEKAPGHALLLTAHTNDGGRNWTSKRLEKLN